MFIVLLCGSRALSHSNVPSWHPTAVDPLMPGVTFIIIPLHYPNRNRRLLYRRLCDSCGFLDLMLPRVCIHRIFFVTSGTERFCLINVIEGLILEDKNSIVDSFETF